MNSLWAARKPRERFLIVICVLAVVVGVPMLLIPPSGGNRKLLSASAARQRYKKLVDEKAQLDRTMDRIKPAISRMAYTERPEELVPKVIRQLQGYAKDSGVHLREIKPLRARKVGTLMKVPMTVRFSTAEFGKSATAFLYRAEDPAGKLVVEKLNVSTADQKTHTVDIEAQVALYTEATGAPGEAAL
jgi:hypothetical protein